MNDKSYLKILTWLGMALMVVFAMAATQPQCAKVQDRTTAPTTSLSPSSGGDDQDLDNGHGGYRECIRRCVREAQFHRAAELIRHLANLRRCDHNHDCIQQENARHRAAMERIAQDERECKAQCHQQGEGHGGE